MAVRFSQAVQSPNLAAVAQQSAQTVGGLADNFVGGYAAAQKMAEENQIREARRSLADLGTTADGTLDYSTAAQRLLAAGDVRGAQALADLGMSQEDRAFRRMQYEQGQQVAADNRAYERGRDQTADQRWQQDYNLRERTASSKGYDVRTITNPDGSTSLVRVDLSTGAVQPMQTPPGTQVSGGSVNPYATGKFNEGQGKAATYADRMAKAETVISNIGDLNQGISGRAAGIAQNILPDTLFNQVSSPERQRLTQAQRDFINAVLRRESGAVISDQEFDNARRQYFPQPGDGPEVIEQKRQNRLTSTQSLMREAGPSYRPPSGWGTPEREAPQPSYSGARPSVVGASPAEAAPYVAPVSSPESPTGKNTDRMPQGTPQQRAAQAIQSAPAGTIVVQGGVRYERQPDGSWVEVQ